MRPALSGLRGDEENAPARKKRMVKEIKALDRVKCSEAPRENSTAAADAERAVCDIAGDALGGNRTKRFEIEFRFLLKGSIKGLRNELAVREI